MSSSNEVLGQLFGTDLSSKQVDDMNIDKKTFEAMKSIKIDGVNLAVDAKMSDFGKAFGSYIKLNEKVVKVLINKGYAKNRDEAEMYFKYRIESEAQNQYAKYYRYYYMERGIELYSPEYR